MSVILVPVSSKKSMNTPIWDNITTAVMDRIRSESMIRSVTTVPSALENDVWSYFAKIPHRVSSPLRGTIRLEAYEMNTAWMQSMVEGFSPRGSRVCFQRIPRNI